MQNVMNGETHEAHPVTAGWSVSVGTLMAIGLFVLALALRLIALDAIPMAVRETPDALAALRAVVPHTPGDPLTASSAAVFLAQAAAFMTMGSSEFAARFVTALAGACLVVTPLLFQRKLGTTWAFAFSLALVFSPTLLLASRQSAPLIWALVLNAVGLWALLRYRETAHNGFAVGGVTLLVAAALLTGWDGLILTAIILIAAFLALREKAEPADEPIETEQEEGEAHRFPWVAAVLVPLGVYQGFKELYEMGLIHKVPRLAIIQAEGCAPMVHAFKAGRDVAESVIPDTRIIILSTGATGQSYTYLWNLVQKYGGTMESVTDAEAFSAMRALAKSEGMAVEPATSVAFAGYEKMRQDGTIKEEELVVVNCTGHTFPVEKHVLGDQWAVDVHLSKDQSPAPREGLQSALENLDEKTTSILLVDDNPDDALLIQRLLEGRKKYRMYHAKDGLEGLVMAKQKLPDLIVSDLTMPGMDGFGLVEELKLDPRTKDIPIVVVSAKDITVEERTRLNGHIEAVYQKGSLPTRKFVDQVIQVIEDKNGS